MQAVISALTGGKFYRLPPDMENPAKGLSNQADVEIDVINVISAADNTFIMSSSQAIVN